MIRQGLYRSRSDRMIAGVCGGLAKCFGFLRERCSSQTSDMPEPGKELKHEKIRAK